MGGKTTPRFYAVRNKDTGEFLEAGGRGSIWSNTVTLQAMNDTKAQASSKMYTLEPDEKKQAEIVGIDVVVLADCS